MRKEVINSALQDLAMFFNGESGKPEYLLRWDLSGRGGGIEIDASYIFDFKNETDTRCATYQNYLGGGLLGAVCFNSAFSVNDLYAKDKKAYELLAEGLKRLHHDLTNHSDNEWEDFSFTQNQNMPVSAY
jgi:hypothetical protein